MSWNSYLGEGRLLGGMSPQVQLQLVGQAQVWKGETIAVLWECYLSDTYRQRPDGLDVLATFWQAVEQNMGVSHIYTLPHEPTLATGYPEFLSLLGYALDPDSEQWWSKNRNESQESSSLT